jgi:predicted enzyme related to lactoylglutathione lyase
MAVALAYAIKFVADMDAAVRFHTSQLGLKLRFQSPEWSEFETGQTTLALHQASPENPAGSCQLGFRVQDIDKFFAERQRAGVQVVSPPTDLHGQRIGKLRDEDGALFSVSGA